MDDELEKDERFNRPLGEDEEVEGHKFIEDEAEREKFVEPPPDEDDEVEAHRF
jgi:hypothetical protein